MFKLPCIDYSNYQVKPRPEPVVVGGSAANNTVEAAKAPRCK